MRRTIRGVIAFAATMILFGASAAAAQDEADPPYPETMFFELAGSYGVQIGDTEYLPSGGLDDWRYPLVHGPAFGGSMGVMLGMNVALVATYEYTWAQSVDGDVTGVIDSVSGTIDYHSAIAGLRLYQPIGFGRLRGELGVGVLFPFHTRREIEYGPGLSQLPTPITGTGVQIENYSIGFGGHAALGYEIPIVDGLYAALNLKYKLFQSENSGETTEYRNFVTDFDALPPTAVDATVTHGDGAAQPETRAVQDARVQLVLGGGF